MMLAIAENICRLQILTFSEEKPQKKKKKLPLIKKGPVEIYRHKLSVNRLIYIKKTIMKVEGKQEKCTSPI